MINVSKIKGVYLDLWAAKGLNLTNPYLAEEKNMSKDGSGYVCCYTYADKSKHSNNPIFNPSFNWQDCGRLIVFCSINLIKNPEGPGWAAVVEKDNKLISQLGSTPQEAVCRCFINIMYGEKANVQYIPTDLPQTPKTWCK